MKIKFKVISAQEIKVGDIFYCTPDFELNEFGEDVMITGSDQIFIMDDGCGEDEDGNYSILVNGGWMITFKPGQKVVRLAHYRDILRILEMVKLAHPDMELGENDSTTLIHDFLEGNPDLAPDLLSRLDIDPEDLDEKSKDSEWDEEDDVDLPF